MSPFPVHMPKKQTSYADFFDEGEEAACPPLKSAMVRAAEKTLGYRLPASYIDLLKVRNGGYLKRSFFPTTQCPRWAEDQVAFDEIMGLGENGIDDDLGSKYLIAEWDYPDVGVVISSDGHTAFMLDYSKCGNQGEPRVVWVDVETRGKGPKVVVLAPNFASFLEKLCVPPDDG